MRFSITIQECSGERPKIELEGEFRSETECLR
jgi:hypothetical protein